MTGKKRNANRGPTALKKYRGTGFEEFYADPPMTPAEAREERENLYHPRIESCIQRFRSRRRLGASDKLFNKYLFLGGIDSNQRMFGGQADADMEGLTPEEKRNATAIDTVYSSGGGSRFYNADEPEGWDVDFAGIVAGFCSENLPFMTAWDYAHMGKAVGLLENFLTYVLQHDVCPEYEGNIREAMELLTEAKVDLPLSHQALLQFPGQLNLAFSELFCGDDFNFFQGDVEIGFRRPVDFNPEVVLMIAAATAGSRKQYEAVMEGITDKTIEIIKEQERAMEVVCVCRPDTETRKVVQSIRLEKGMQSGFAPVGTVVLKPCVIEDGYDHGDMRVPSEQEETFFLDDAILMRLRPGFKLQLSICELNIGIKFIKKAHRVLVAWHTYLPQNLMAHFKEPVANERPAPSAAIPQGSEGIAGSSFK
ncbi:Argonaute-binding protein 1 [Colletotrichum chlorophyti]|uniref:Argonaute-binding protein 1 n=1 Tax=Colletotrichum chlorophyti TaxID=708187 RepID=A0A1Q8S2S8_9PEZI|nr:Argonaute-binding protein 1 [Colletotrichum chlorophyti]